MSAQYYYMYKCIALPEIAIINMYLESFNCLILNCIICLIVVIVIITYSNNWL